MNVLESIIKESIKTKAETSADLARVKRKIAKENNTSCPSNIELLKAYHKMMKNKRIKRSETIEKILRTRPVRSLSGIVNVSVLTKPYPCPGKCIYCPSQKGVPKSYLDNEPAVMRAILNKYNPFKQVQMRLKALKNTGHPVDKIELRIIGGTWSYYPRQYQTWFVTRCFAACNAKLIRNKNARLTRKTKSLREEQKINEKAKHRIVGLSVETRPDFIDVEEIKRLRKSGVTMVEMGVQSIYEDVLKLNKRGHKIKTTIQATKLLKDAGFKVCYQMMPNLPGSNLKRDKKMFEELFSNSNFQPDLLKIYPTAVLKGTLLYQWLKQGKYKPYSDKRLIKLIKDIKKEIPYYVRIQRIIRDIPSQSIVVGPAKISNLRQLIAKASKRENWRCKCIRCREVKGENPNFKIKDLKLFRQNYNASGGREIFLSFEDKKREKLFALLRLRIPQLEKNISCPERIAVLKDAAIIREVHAYGQMIPVGQKSISVQHKGLGKKLIKEAEEISKREFGYNKIAVISGAGVRKYYSSKLGYKLKETYMLKEI